MDWKYDRHYIFLGTFAMIIGAAVVSIFGYHDTAKLVSATWGTIVGAYFTASATRLRALGSTNKGKSDHTEATGPNDHERQELRRLEESPSHPTSVSPAGRRKAPVKSVDER